MNFKTQFKYQYKYSEDISEIKHWFRALTVIICVRFTKIVKTEKVLFAKLMIYC